MNARRLAVIVAVVLLLRIPFLNEAIQGDDVYYLTGAEHAQIEPLHPNHFRYVFLGDEVDMRGHSHPPLNVWFLALLLAIFGDIREVPFHAVYILFSLIAALSMWSLARRFSPHPLWATLLFLAVPSFVVNGTSLESDLPFLAFWMASIALVAVGQAFSPVWFLLLAISLILASLTAFQAIFLTPILAVYIWLYARRRKDLWVAAFIPPAALLAWQLFERFTTGKLPASVLAGYFQTYGFQALVQKIRSAIALMNHACWLVFPGLLPAAFIASWKRRDRDTFFLVSWIALFFACAVIALFAGSARYLLPIAAPVALLVSRLRPKWLAIGFACQMALGLSLAIVNYQHWNGYRTFAASLEKESSHRRIWINGDWGLRYYLEAEGGLPLTRGQALRPGDLVVSSQLANPTQFTHPGSALVPISSRQIRPALPLRLIGIDARSGYSTSSKGLRPFDISAGPIDIVRADLVVERQPALSDLPMNAPEAAQQIVSGIYDLEGGRWRWTSKEAVVLLKTPQTPAPLRAVFAIHDRSPARKVTLLLDSRLAAEQTYSAPGNYTLDAPARALASSTATVSLVIDKTFSVPGDSRELGVILSEIGFKK